MKKIVYLIALLVGISALGQNNPAKFKNGVDTPLFRAYTTYTNAQLDALTDKEEGDKRYSSTDSEWKVYNGTTWEVLGGSSSSSTNIFNSNGVTPDASNRFLDIGAGGLFAIRSNNDQNYFLIDDDEVDLFNKYGPVQIRTGTSGTFDTSAVGYVFTDTDGTGKGKWQPLGFPEGYAATGKVEDGDLIVSIGDHNNSNTYFKALFDAQNGDFQFGDVDGIDVGFTTASLGSQEEFRVGIKSAPNTWENYIAVTSNSMAWKHPNSTFITSLLINPATQNNVIEMPNTSGTIATESYVDASTPSFDETADYSLTGNWDFVEDVVTEGSKKSFTARNGTSLAEIVSDGTLSLKSSTSDIDLAIKSDKITFDNAVTGGRLQISPILSNTHEEVFLRTKTANDTIALISDIQASTPSSTIQHTEETSAYTFNLEDAADSKVLVNNGEGVVTYEIPLATEVNYPNGTIIPFHTVTSTDTTKVSFPYGNERRYVQTKPKDTLGETGFAIVKRDSLHWYAKGDFEYYAPDPYGAELLPDPSVLTADSPATTTYSNGVWSFNGASNFSLAGVNDILEVGKTYKIEFEIVNYVSGSFRFTRPFGNSARSANGVYVYEDISTTDDIEIGTSTGEPHTFDVINLSVKEKL